MSETIDVDQQPNITEDVKLATELMETVLRNSVSLKPKNRVMPAPLKTRGKQAFRINDKNSKKL